MIQRTLSNKTRISILRKSGFLKRMSTSSGRTIINSRRRKKRLKLAIIK